VSFSDKPGLSGRQKFGCALVAAIGVLVTGLGAIFAALGSCPECDANPVSQFLLLPGIPIFFIGVGIFMIWHFMRDKD
jgi:predicted benzoate:H+ symporter BenE